MHSEVQLGLMLGVINRQRAAAQRLTGLQRFEALRSYASEDGSNPEQNRSAQATQAGTLLCVYRFS